MTQNGTQSRFDAFETFKPRLPAPMGESFTDCNVLDARAATNCPMGGDAGHGGVTVVELVDQGSTAWDVVVDGVRSEQPRKLQVVLMGDAEATTFVRALRFLANELEVQLRLNQRPAPTPSKS